MRTNRFLPRLTTLEDRRTPATFTVTTFDDVVDGADGKLSLREAITAANATPEADKVVLKAGVYKITLTGNSDNGNVSGDFDITAPVTIAGLGLDKTYIDGNYLDRVFDVDGEDTVGMPVNFAKLTIRNGNAPGSGGGIKSFQSTIKLTDAAVTDCVASVDGGGVRHGGNETVTLIRSAIRRNVAVGDHGGGVATSTSVVATDSVFARNFAELGGGGLYVGESLTMTNTVVRDNVVSNGDGGGFIAFASVLDGCTVSGNRTSGNGGGFIAETNGPGTTLTNTVVSNNRAGSNGGGFHVFTGEANLTDCTVRDNKAGLSGGGMWTLVDTRLNQTDVAANRARHDGGGVFAGDELFVGKSRFVDNFSGTSGGGIAAGSMILVESTVDGNATDGFGGGISAGTSNIVDSTISRNDAGTNGGGANLDQFAMTNVTVSGNTAGGLGGGVHFTDGGLLNCTIVENAAGDAGGGLYATSGNPSLQNTIVAQNVAYFSTNWDISGAIDSQGGNFIGNVFGTSGYVSTDIVGGFVGSLDPRLGDLKSVKGKPATHTPKAGSPVIDAGVPTSLSVDANGKPRVKGAAIDIGAVEK